MPEKFGLKFSENDTLRIREQAVMFAAEITDPATGRVDGSRIEKERWCELFEYIHLNCWRAGMRILTAKDPAMADWRSEHSKAYEDAKGMLKFSLEMTSGISDLPSPQEILGLPKPEPATPSDFVNVVLKSIENDYERAIKNIYVQIKSRELFTHQELEGFRKKGREIAMELYKSMREDNLVAEIPPEETSVWIQNMCESLFCTCLEAEMEMRLNPTDSSAAEEKQPPSKPRHLHAVPRRR